MSIEAMKQALEFLESRNKSAALWMVPNTPLTKTVTTLRDAIEQAEKQNDRIASLENTCYTLIGKLQVANLKLAFRDLRPEVEHHAARILNEEFGEKK
jgi:hypothetical protein